ncbi:fam-a protein [Plasmodium vinckei vinckei]|uniref:Fam-a protein n=1 Tax=Plasmodium vinckei vinckei TaxID=54757 RepID=A0A449BRW7_PLAVN|nr:fam-a protein [Plasmodium vinckei vinckei]VEV56210.1 fam-a protein [Plasmodium vinckei vinckei]
MNRGYIKTVFFVLSLVVCAINNTLASQPALKAANKAKITEQRKTAADAKREEYKRKLCKDPEETQLAMNYANENAALLLKVAESMDGFTFEHKYGQYCETDSKKLERVDVDRFHATIKGHYMYSSTINKIWDYADFQKLDFKFIHGNPVRIYNSDLVLFEKYVQDEISSIKKKKYALGAKVQVSDDITVILCPTRVIRYELDIHGNINTKEMLENSKSIYHDDMDPDEALSKLNSTLSGLIIKKGNNDLINITYVNVYLNYDHNIDFYSDRKHGNTIHRSIMQIAYWGGENKSQYSPGKFLSLY